MRRRRRWLGPALRHVYADDRFDWKTIDGDVVRVHWVEGDQAFGRRALQIGDDAVAATAKLLGVTESDPIDFFIYADETSFRDALGPATRENVGGQAHPGHPDLVRADHPRRHQRQLGRERRPPRADPRRVRDRRRQPYHDPPHWLNEGLAVYLADGYGDFDRSQVEAAARDGSIIPLDGLAGAFPTTRDRFFLAYAESVSAVERIVRVDGRDALVKLIRSYAGGVSDDDAFQAALGRDVAGFEADWLAELGAKPPTRLGPKPAPVGPLPEGWNGPQPNPSFEVVGSTPPVTPSAPFPGPVGDQQGVLSIVAGPLFGIGAVLIVVIVDAGAAPAPSPSAARPCRRDRRQPTLRADRGRGRRRRSICTGAVPPVGGDGLGAAARSRRRRRRVGGAMGPPSRSRRRRRTPPCHPTRRPARPTDDVALDRRPDPGDPDLAGHARGRAARARLPDRRPARRRGAPDPVHDPGAVAARRDGADPPDPAGRAQGADRRPPQGRSRTSSSRGPARPP